MPAKVRASVLGEYRHRCAVCGVGVPQLHHIDENPSNNDRMNLLPLCPNCHHLDQHDPHNPTVSIDVRILRLFREFKDPLILAPQFKPYTTGSRISMT